MKKKQIFDEFEILGEKLGLRIIKGKGDFNGGICKINNKTVIVINRLKPLEHRLKVLATSFLEHNLDGIYIVPYLRAFIEQFRHLDAKI